MTTSQTAKAFEIIKNKIQNFTPKIGLILGSGLHVLAEQLEETITIPYKDVPGFSECSVQGHKGLLLLGRLNGVPIACLQGRAHYYEGHTNAAIQVPIRTLKLLGCETLLLTNAAASLRENVQPGNLVLINDHINFQFHNPLVGINDDTFGPRFPSMQNAYDEKLRQLILETASSLDIKIYEGVYLATIGPSYETPAEIRAFRLLGADVVGMSTVPEVIIARHCGLKVACISSITNMGCGMSQEPLTHEGVLKVANQVASNLARLIYEFLPKIQENDGR